MELRHKFLRFVIATAAIFQAACGGGSPTPPAEGFYSGTFAGDMTNKFNLLVLENNEIWIFNISLYQPFLSGFNDTPPVSSIFQGQGAASNSVLTSSTLGEFANSPFDSLLNGTFSANYIANQSVNGSLAYSGRTMTFSGIPLPASRYSYGSPTSLSTLVGEWSLTTPFLDSGSMTIAANGDISGNHLGMGCTASFSGKITPRSSGKNVFNISITPNPSMFCPQNETSNGIGITYLDNDNISRRLEIGALNALRTNGIAFTAYKMPSAPESR